MIHVTVPTMSAIDPTKKGCNKGKRTEAPAGYTDTFSLEKATISLRFHLLFIRKR